MSLFNFSFLISSKQDLSEHSICVNIVVMAVGGAGGGVDSFFSIHQSLLNFFPFNYSSAKRHIHMIF